MCKECGCDASNKVKITNLSGIKFHAHSHAKNVDININVLDLNDETANENRRNFTDDKILALNFVSSPGAGKTTLLAQTIKALKDIKIYVIEGDQQTLNDAKRIQDAGAKAVQINTGDGCHLDAQMIARARKELNPAPKSILAIENVGNLVCPAMFDLGEHLRIVVASVTEGEDKPLKYPNMFASSNVCVISKTDLLPYLNFDIAQLENNLKLVNKDIKIIRYSKDDPAQWLEYLKGEFLKFTA